MTFRDDPVLKEWHERDWDIKKKKTCYTNNLRLMDNQMTGLPQAKKVR